MIGRLSDPYIVPPTVPLHDDPVGIVSVPSIAEVKYEVLKKAEPVIIPALCDEPRKVALPVIIPVF